MRIRFDGALDSHKYGILQDDTRSIQYQVRKHSPSDTVLHSCKTWIFIAKHRSYVWTVLHRKYVTWQFKSILLSKCCVTCFICSGNGKISNTSVMTAWYITVKELHGAASRMAFCRVKLQCCPVWHCHHWHYWCGLFLRSVLRADWWLRQLLTSVSGIFYCMYVIVRCPECKEAMILHTLEKTELLAIGTYNN